MAHHLVTLGLFTAALLAMLVRRVRRDTGDRIDTLYFRLAALAAAARVVVLALAELSGAPVTHPAVALGGVATGLASVHFLVLFAYSFPLNRPAPLTLRGPLGAVTVLCTLYVWQRAHAEVTGVYLLLFALAPSYFALALVFLHRNWRAERLIGARRASAPERILQASVVVPWALSLALLVALDRAYAHHVPGWVFLAQAVGTALVVLGGGALAVLRYHLFAIRVLMLEVVLGVAASSVLAGYVGLAAGPLIAWLSAEVSPEFAAVVVTGGAALLTGVVMAAVDGALNRVSAEDAGEARGVVEKTLAVTARVVDPDAVLAMVVAAITEATGADVRFLRVGTLPPNATAEAPASLVALIHEPTRGFFAPEHAPELPSALLAEMECLDAQLLVPVRRDDALYGVVVVARGAPVSRSVAQVCVTLAEHLALKLQNFALYAEAAQASRALADYRAFLEDLVDSLPVGVAVVDGSLRVKAWNRSLEAQSGIAREKALGARYFDDLFPERRDANAEDIIAELSVNPERVAQRPSLRVEGPDGPRYQDISVAPFKDRLGVPTGVVVISQDVTERVRLAQELEESRRLASLGAFAAAIAHDIRTPLTSIQMNVQILGACVGLSDSDREYVDIALTEIDRLNRAVGEILEYARPLSLARVACDPAELAADVVRSLAPVHAEHGVEVVFAASATAPGEAVAFDERHVRKVLVNLIDNAAEASKPGDRVEVRAHAEPAGAVFVVIDRGKGIDPSQRERIFEPFFTTRADGTGLGLANARKIVRAHGGDIRVESAPGEGSRFTVTLPRAASS